MWAETLIDSSRTGKLTTIYVYGYPLVNIQKTIENHHWNSGISHWKWWFSIAMLNYQRVKFMKQKSWQPGFTARKKQPQKKSHIVHRCPCPNIFTTHLPWTKTLSWWQFQWSHRNIATEPDKLTTAGNTYQMLPLYIPRDISISIHIIYIFFFYCYFYYYYYYYYYYIFPYIPIEGKGLLYNRVACWMSHSSLGPFGDQFLSHGLSLGGWLMAHSFWQENVIPSKTCSEKWRGKLWKKWTDLSASFKKIIVCCFCVCMCTWLYSYSYYYCCYLYFLLGGWPWKQSNVAE